MNRKGTNQIGSTNITENIVKILLRKGIINNVRKHQERNKYFLVLTLQHRRHRKGPHRTILNLRRISRPGLQIYSNYQQIPTILSEMGLYLFTSQGIMTDWDARIKETGGEILCYIW
ncbi:hypothetical protein V6Z11_A03G081500 [Gossypium hirsutum]